MKPSVLIPLFLILAPNPLLAGPELDPLREIAIQEGGRLKPLDTFARETARRVGGAKPFTGGESILGLDPVEWILSMLASPERWRGEPIVKVTHAGLRQAAGLPAGKDRYSFKELASHEGFLTAAEAAHEKQRKDPEAKLDPVEREVAQLYDTLSLMASLFTGEGLRIVPHPSDPRATWFSLADLQQAEAPALQRVGTLMAAVVSAYQAGDKASLASAATALRSRLAELSPGIYPAATALTREVHYNRFKPFRSAWVLYLLGFLLLLASFPLQARPISWAGTAAVLAGFGLHAYGMALRVLISGHPPVTNMYESVIWVAWGAMAFALIFEAVYRARYFAVCASALAVICLILADNVPILNGSIEPLVPVLRDNMWLTIHVLTITLGYAAFLLAMGIGHANLGLYFFAPQRAALLKTLSLFLYRALQVGTLFLAVGTMLGGVWASYSWGRFWGWDPKETWALIALLGYLAILHGRMVGWFKDFGTAVGSLLGFLLVLMAWYGVNFVLGAGLHSYGFGSGGYAYVGGFVAFEVLVIVGALARYRGQAAKKALLQSEVPMLKKLAPLALVLLSLTGTARAAEQAITFKSGASDQGSGLLVTPEGKGPFPAVVVIQEWWGLSDWVKDQARGLAKDGYVALAVDLYRGKLATKQEDAHQYMMGLPDERAAADLAGAFATLAARADVKKDRIGSIGWCMGGKWSLRLAMNEPTLAAAVVYYGAMPTRPEEIAKLKAPVLGNFGGDDQGPAPDQVKAFEAGMKAAGKTADLKIYDGAGHAFANVNNPWGGYREAAAKDAAARTSAFFAKYLKK